MASPSDLVYYSGYMKRIAFLDGQVLHDFHLNLMQKNIAEAIKMKTTQERYDFYMLVSPYNMYFMEPFVTEGNKDAEESTNNWNSLEFSISQGAWVTKLLELPHATDEICILSQYEDYPDDGATVHFYFRSSKESDWVPVVPDQAIYLPTSIKYVQVKCECQYTGTIRPTVYDFALLFK